MVAGPSLAAPRLAASLLPTGGPAWLAQEGEDASPQVREAFELADLLVMGIA